MPLKTSISNRHQKVRIGLAVRIDDAAFGADKRATSVASVALQDVGIPVIRFHDPLTAMEAEKALSTGSTRSAFSDESRFHDTARSQGEVSSGIGTARDSNVAGAAVVDRFQVALTTDI